MHPDSQAAAPIKLLLSDVDGVLTNGQLVYDDSGRESKAFHVRDGLGIKLWQRAGYTFGIVTARSSQIVENRATELGIHAVRQGCDDKLAASVELMKQYDLTPKETCFIGDDLPDLGVMRSVALPVAVSDAAADVRSAAVWQTNKQGGQGAVRELIERLLKAKSQWDTVVQT